MLGYIFTLNDGAIYWKNFKQHIMIDSVCKAEYIMTSNAVKEAVWLWKFIDELEVESSINGPVLLYYDSIGTIAQVKEPKSHQCTKHILYFYHLIQKIMDRGDIDL